VCSAALTALTALLHLTARAAVADGPFVAMLAAHRRAPVVAGFASAARPTVDEAVSFLAGLTGEPVAVAAYLDELETYPVYRAVEMDLGHQLPVSPENAARLDYRIGSMHNVVDENGARIQVSRQGEPEGGWDRYMELYLAAFRRDVLAGTVRMIGHPTFLPLIRGGMHDQLWTPARRRAYIEAAVESGVGLEISTRYNVPSPVFMREALDAGARFAVGSDSHWLDRTAEIALPLCYVKEFDIPEDRFFLPARVIQEPSAISG